MKNKLGFITILLAFIIASSGCSVQPTAADKTIKIAMATEPDSLDYYKSAATDTDAMMQNVHRGLVFFDTAGNLIPAIAESFTISDNGLNYNFKLREDVVFHNGAKLTASDVVYSFRKLAGLDGSKANSKFTVVQSVNAINDYEVEIGLNVSDSSFLSRCKIAVLPSGYEDQGTKPIGCGPFKFIEYNPTRNLKLERFDDYFDKEHMPKIKVAEFVFFADSNSQFLALSTGVVDLSNISYENAASLPASLRTQFVPMNTVQGLFMNLSIAPFNILEVRQAISHAIDITSIIEVTTSGKGIQASTLLSPTQTAWYNEATANPYPYDPEKAISLLKQAGFENGFDIEITVPSNYKVHVDAAQIIADQLEDVGIHATIKLVEWAQWLKDVYTDSNFQTTVSGFSGKLDPYDVFVRYQSEYTNNFFKFDNDSYDYLVSRARLETNAALRLSCVKQLQQILVDEAASVCIQDVTYVYGMKSEVSGFVSYPTTFYDLSLLDISN